MSPDLSEKVRRARPATGASPTGGGSSSYTDLALNRAVGVAAARGEQPVLITTTNDVAGYRVDQVFGEVFGLTVRSRHIGSQMGAAFKSLGGGELKGMTKNLEESRLEALSPTASAEALGADGTACRVTQL